MQPNNWNARLAQRWSPRRESGHAEVTPAEFAKSTTIELKPWARVEVTYAPGGKPIAGQMFSVGSGGGDVVNLHYSESPTTDSEGKFVLERTPSVQVYA